MKFAYLIMVHNRFDVLKELLIDLDDERNDIFLHIDKKTKNVDFDSIKQIVKKSRIYFIPRMKIFWGDFSQIKCIWSLLEYATKNGYYDYYHFMVGVEYPLKNQNYIHNFFEKNEGCEFVGFDKYDMNYLNRIRYYHLAGKYNRSNSFWGKLIKKINEKSLILQKKVSFSRTTKGMEYFKKGYANWSITDAFARYLVKQKKYLSIYKYTLCADEIIIHTFLFNSPFYKMVFDKDDEYRSAMRITTWKDSKNQYHMQDVEELVNSDYLFARKFDTTDALQIIECIKKFRKLIDRKA